MFVDCPRLNVKKIPQGFGLVITWPEGSPRHGFVQAGIYPSPSNTEYVGFTAVAESGMTLRTTGSGTGNALGSDDPASVTLLCQD